MTSVLRTLAATAVLLGPSALPAIAQSSYSQSYRAPRLGTTIRGSATTVFRVTASGDVSRISGNAIRLSNASVQSPTITLNCGSFDSSCAYRYLRVRITPATGTGVAKITRLRVGSLSGGQFYGGRPSDAAALDFYLYPLNRATASFDLGMDVSLAANAPGGNHDFGYLVTVQLQ